MASISGTARNQMPDLSRSGYILGRGSSESVLTVAPRFKIEDAKYTIDSLAAWACIRLDRLKQGYRFLRLVDAKAAPTEGMLLLKVEKTIS